MIMESRISVPLPTRERMPRMEFQTSAPLSTHPSETMELWIWQRKIFEDGRKRACV